MTSTSADTTLLTNMDDSRAGLLARVPGVLYIMAALVVVSISANGAAAPVALDVAPLGGHAADQRAESIAWSDASAAPDADTSAPQAAAPAAETGMSFKSGDKLSPEQIEQLKVRLAAMQAAGLHKGPGIVSSWE